MTRRMLVLGALVIAAPAAANGELNISRTSEPVNDAVNTLTPARNLPGATIDHMVTVTNPLANALVTIRSVSITEAIPATIVFRVANLNASGGPVEFLNGNVLAIPLGSSTLSYSYGGLASTTDGLAFTKDGTNYDYTPVDDGSGYDPLVRGVRVTLTGASFSTVSGFRLRYRVKLK
jgi:hypothetical protein